MENRLQQLATLFRNVVLNAAGVERDFLSLIRDRDIDKAVGLLQDRHEDVDEAIREYNPQTHRVMNRADKLRRGADPYVTEKLPRSRQRYINEVELFFLLGTPVKYKKIDGSDEAYDLFVDFIKSYRIDALHRQLKRLAGSETEAALVYHLFQEDGQIQCKPFIVARSTGYDLRPLFDQYGNLLALGYGYQVKGSAGARQHWDILTPEANFECVKDGPGMWDVETRENVTGKILAIYARQSKAWDGVERRIEREEDMDSKIGDSNNYFADPIAFATADVVQLMAPGEADRVGRLIQYSGRESQFGYIDPPQNSEARRDEKADLAFSILFDSFTPDFSYETIKGLGTLSGEAMENAMILGFIKRANRIEIYGELLDREVNVIKAVLKVLHPQMSATIDALQVEVEFQSPFMKQNTSLWQNISALYQSGVVSLETAVELLSLTDAPQEEIEKIRGAQADAFRMQAAARAGQFPAGD